MRACRVVLVRPEIAGNVGATARVMHNMGLTDLVLVAPKADPLCHEARQRSTHGEHLLHSCRIVETLTEAVSDCLLVAGTSARAKGLFREQSLGSPEQILPQFREMMKTGPVALVFGPEPNGLANAEILQCHALIHIPTDSTHHALNLGQAIAICLYELRKQWLASDEGEPPEEPAPFEDQDRMFGQLREALEAIHFLYDERADQLMHAIRHLIGRASPSPNEVRILQGLARQIKWYVEHHPPTNQDTNDPEEG